MKTILGLLFGAGIGAAIGYSQILCPDGHCPLTGSWQGGALFGAGLGLMLFGGGSRPAAGSTEFDESRSDQG